MMIYEPIRRTLSALLMTSMLTSSLTPAFAIDSDDEDEDSAVVAARKQPVTSQAQTAATNKKFYVFGPLFRSPPHTPSWASLFDALCADDICALKAVSRATRHAHRNWVRNIKSGNMRNQGRGRMFMEGLFSNPKQSARYQTLIIDGQEEKGEFPKTVRAYEDGQWLSADLHYNYQPSSLAEDLIRTLTLDNLTLGEMTVRDLPSLRALLQGASEKTVLHVTLMDILSDPQIQDLIQHPLNLRNLSSLNVRVETPACALNLLNHLKSALNIGDLEDTRGRPSIDLFVNRALTPFETLISTDHDNSDAETDEATSGKRGGHPDVSPDVLGYVNEAVQDFNAFQTSWLKRNQENIQGEDLYGALLKDLPLIRLTSLSDFMNRSAETDDYSPLYPHRLAILKEFFQWGDAADSRAESLEVAACLQPSTLLSLLPYARKVIKEGHFEGLRELSNFIEDLAPYPASERPAVVERIFNEETKKLSLNAKMSALYCLKLFPLGQHEEATQILFQLGSFIMDSDDENSDNEDTLHVETFDNPNDDLELESELNKIPQGHRLDVLRSAVTYLTEGLVKRTTNHEFEDVLSSLINVFGSFSSAEERQELDGFLRERLPLLDSSIAVPDYLRVVALVPSNLRARIPQEVFDVFGTNPQLHHEYREQLTNILVAQADNPLFIVDLKKLMTPSVLDLDPVDQTHLIPLGQVLVLISTLDDDAQNQADIVQKAAAFYDPERKPLAYEHMKMFVSLEGHSDCGASGLLRLLNALKFYTFSERQEIVGDLPNWLHDNREIVALVRALAYMPHKRRMALLPVIRSIVIRLADEKRKPFPASTQDGVIREEMEPTVNNIWDMTRIVSEFQGTSENDRCSPAEFRRQDIPASYFDILGQLAWLHESDMYSSASFLSVMKRTFSLRGIFDGIEKNLSSYSFEDQLKIAGAFVNVSAYKPDSILFRLFNPSELGSDTQYAVEIAEELASVLKEKPEELTLNDLIPLWNQVREKVRDQHQS